jgi:glycosyltransferase involved in cell wall biosynthesis
MPDISVLMTVYNTPLPYVMEAVGSVLKQQADYEFVVVDDGSQDPQLVAYLDELALLDHVRFARCEENLGVGAAANVGLALCTSDLVSRFGADDRMPPHRLAYQIDYMRTHPEVDVLGGQMRQMGPDMREIPHESPTRFRLRPGPVADQYAIAHGTVVYRKHVVLNAGGYDPRPWRGADYRLWQTLDHAGARFALTDDILLDRRVWPGSHSYSRSTYLQTLYREWQRPHAT